MNINRPQTTGKMRINYASNNVGKLLISFLSLRGSALTFILQTFSLSKTFVIWKAQLQVIFVNGYLSRQAKTIWPFKLKSWSFDLNHLNFQHLSHNSQFVSTLIWLGMQPNEYGGSAQDGNQSAQQHHRGSRKNISLGKQTERAVSLVT